MGARPLARAVRGEGGFTLVETLISLIVVSIVGLALFQVLTVSKGSVEDQTARLEAQQNARVALNSLAEDFRHVSYGKDATQPSIFYATDDSVVFVADVFLDRPGAEVISYYLSPDGDADTANPTDTILMKTVADTTGQVLVSAPQSYGLSASGLQMRYFTGDNTEIATPVAQPETVGEIRLQVAGVSPRPLRNGDYHTVTLSTTIYPRNLPLTPARSRPNPPINNGANAPNCESMTVKWLPPTTNTDGTALDPNDISHFNFYMATNGSQRNLHARLARTIFEWTVSGLSSGNTYDFHVTAVSRAGVESYPMIRTVDFDSGFFPSAPEDLVADVINDTAQLSWSAVTTFSDGSSLTTPAFYKVYRDAAPGFTPGPGTLVAQTSEGQTSYDDIGLTPCGDYYYKVVAVACSNDGDPSDAVRAIVPAPPACPSNVSANLGAYEGDLIVSWDAPTTRMDGTPLIPADLIEYHVYVDTIPDAAGDSVVVSGNQTSTTVTVLPCMTYYVNVRAHDQCDSPGDLCPANEFQIYTSAPCTPGPPDVPTGLVSTPSQTQARLDWNANTTDCDLYGYRVWYGHSAGGPYNGVGAAQGSSPITVAADDVTSGGAASYTLTGLEGCASYYFVVTAIDVCDPFEESATSNETVAGTQCIACGVEPTCSPFIAFDGGFDTLSFGVHATGSTESIVEVVPSWNGGRKLREFHFDGALVWKHDGSAGNDGNIGPASAGTTIHPWDFDVLGSSTADDGHKVTMVFDGDIRNRNFSIQFSSGGPPCVVNGTAKELLAWDDFDDGNYSGWTVSNGNWSVDNGSLRQTNDQSDIKWIHLSNLTYGNDFVFEAEMNIVAGGYGLFQFNRASADDRHIGYLYYWSQEGRLGKLTPSYTDFSGGPYSFNEGEWHKVKVEREGSVFKLWADCNLITSASVSSPPSGRFGFGTYYSYVRFDDVAIVEN